MNTSSAKLLVLAGEHFACVKIIGRANFSSSIDFKTLISELRQKAYTYFVLDLSECALMDSTFLGVLAGFGLKLGGANAPGTSPIELLNPSPRISELLENLGVIHLFKVTEGAVQLPDGAEACAVTPVSANREQVTQACLEAHRTLMELNPANVSRFKEVTQFLAEDLKKIRAEKGTQQGDAKAL
jgi:anti-anti-sigma regulatory factor